MPSIAEPALLNLRRIDKTVIPQVQVRSKDFCFDEELKSDLVVDGCLLVEVKAVQEIHLIRKAQTLSDMRLLDVPVGLILNFHELRLNDGLHRMLLSGANLESAVVTVLPSIAHTQISTAINRSGVAAYAAFIL